MLDLSTNEIKLTKIEKQEYKVLRKDVKEIYKIYSFPPDNPTASPFPKIKDLFEKASQRVLYFYYKKSIQNNQDDSTLNKIMASLICGMASGQMMSYITEEANFVLISLATIIITVLCGVLLIPSGRSNQSLVKERELEIITDILNFDEYLDRDKSGAESEAAILTDTPSESAGEEETVSYDASEQFCEVAKHEYDYESSRNSTLDNKVSMTLAFCGAVFLFFMNYLDVRTIWESGTACNCQHCFIKYTSLLLQIACLGCFIVCIIKLFYILRPKTYCRLDASYVLDDTLPEWDQKKAYMYLGKSYTDIAAFNRTVNENRSMEYSHSIKWLLVAMLLYLINEIVRLNLL